MKKRYLIEGVERRLKIEWEGCNVTDSPDDWRGMKFFCWGAAHQARADGKDEISDLWEVAADVAAGRELLAIYARIDRK